MQDSLTSRLLSASWELIAGCVTTQLAKDSVAAAVRVASTSIDEPAAWTWRHFRSPGAFTRLAVETGTAHPQSIKVESRLRLSLSELRKPNLDQVTAWARAVRLFELTQVLTMLTAVGRPCRPIKADLKAHPPRGSGISLLHWKPMLPNIDELESTVWGKPKLLDSAPDASSAARGLLVCNDGGPVVRRDPDLELDWLPAIDGVELMLSGRLQLRNATSETVTVLRRGAVDI
jgi:hypothetical protein